MAPQLLGPADQPSCREHRPHCLPQDRNRHGVAHHFASLGAGHTFGPTEVVKAASSLRLRKRLSLAQAVSGLRAAPHFQAPKAPGFRTLWRSGLENGGVTLALRVLMHQNLQCQGVRNPLALRLKIGLTCYLFWGVRAIKPQTETTTSCCLLSGALMCSVCPSSRFTLRPAASFPPVASSADLLRCRRKSVKRGEEILEGEENWHQKPPRVEKVESHCQRKWPIMLGSDCSGWFSLPPMWTQIAER